MAQQQNRQNQQHQQNQQQRPQQTQGRSSAEGDPSVNSKGDFASTQVSQGRMNTKDQSSQAWSQPGSKGQDAEIRQNSTARQASTSHRK